MARPTEKYPNGAKRNRRRGSAVGSDLSAKITLTVTDVQRFLGKSKRAFYLLRRDPMEEFPTPFLIQGRDHWLMRLEHLRKRLHQAFRYLDGLVRDARQAQQVNPRDLVCPKCGRPYERVAGRSPDAVTYFHPGGERCTT